MARRLRIDRGGIAYHVLNRRVGRLPLFEKHEDYVAFEKVLDEAYAKTPMRVISYCLMPNHWHLVLWPTRDGQTSRYMQWLTTTHMRRWHAHHGTRGTGSVYQGRFKSFPIQEDRHFLIVCRYVERNALRANLVERAEDWPWSSLARRRREDVESPWLVAVKDWPASPPRNWPAFVNRPGTEAELDAVRRSVARGAPYGEASWQRRTAVRLKLESSLRPPWRPKRDEHGKKK
ncbi:MAG: transposase [Phycisphaerae bacterium]|nr:transposase [Phycisphaerae bacterium]